MGCNVQEISLYFSGFSEQAETRTTDRSGNCIETPSRLRHTNHLKTNAADGVNAPLGFWMQIPGQLELQTTDTLRSGQFYAVEVVHRCYRINEPDHFLQDQVSAFFAYLDKSGQLRHFNRPRAQAAASTPLLDLLKIPGTKLLRFQEASAINLDQLRTGGVQPESPEEQQSVELMQMVVQAFSGQQSEDAGVEHSLESLRLEHGLEYLDPPDLKH